MEDREKRFWRELIRVTYKDDDSINIVIPAYDTQKELFFRKNELLPEDWNRLQVGRLFANVNSDAGCDADLVIKDVEEVSTIRIMTKKEILEGLKVGITPENLIEEIMRLRSEMVDIRSIKFEGEKLPREIGLIKYGTSFNIACPFCDKNTPYITKGYKIPHNEIRVIGKKCYNCGKLVEYHASWEIFVRADNPLMISKPTVPDAQKQS